jgi:hypothetical protein
MGLAGGRLPRILLVLCAAMGFAPLMVLADWKDFVPQPFENGAYVDLFSSYERDHVSSGTPVTSEWNDTFIREKLTLFSNGYSYHPRFMQYHFSIAGAVKQENYESSAPVPTGWTDGTGLDYDIKMVFLPEHPYNLELFARQYEPVFKEESAIQHNSVETSRGFNFRYRKKPYFLHTGYVDDSLDSAGITSDVQRFSLDGQYFKRYANGSELSLNGAYIPSWFSNSEGLSGNSTQYLIGNTLSSGELAPYSSPFLFWFPQQARLSSSASKDDFEQQGSTSGDFQNDQLSWYEALNVYLPANFRADGIWRYQDNSTTVSGVGTSEPSNLSYINKQVQADLVNRLYQSLDTTYTFLYNDQSSSGGDTTATTNSLALNYVKSIPWGRFLAGGTLARSDTDTSGSIQVLNEPHLGVYVVPPGSFTLDQQNVLEPSIVVLLKSPLPPFELIPLVRDVNYVVEPAEPNTFQIVVISLPAQFATPGNFDFFVSYALVSGQFTLRTDDYAANTSVQLFDNLLTPYFNYLRITSSVLSGFFPGIPVDSTTYTAGLVVYKGPVRARGEYQQLDWNVTPYRAWRGDVQYVASLNETTSVYATAGYQNKYYPHGSSAYSPGQAGITSASPYTEQSEAISGNIQKQFFSRNMSLNLSGSYAGLQGPVDSNGYSATVTWLWTIGKVDLSVGASVYGAATSGTDVIPTNRDHEYFYLNFRRRLF